MNNLRIYHQSKQHQSAAIKQRERFVLRLRKHARAWAITEGPQEAGTSFPISILSFDKDRAPVIRVIGQYADMHFHQRILAAENHLDPYAEQAEHARRHADELALAADCRRLGWLADARRALQRAAVIREFDAALSGDLFQRAAI